MKTVRLLRKLIPEALEKVKEEERERIKLGVFGEMSRSELESVVSSMARAVGHTYSAINGVKNSHNALLVIAHIGQKDSIDLPKEKSITLEQIKRGHLMGRKAAIVMDNYALIEVYRDLMERFKRMFQSLTEEDGKGESK